MKLLYAEDERSMSEAVVDILSYHKYIVDAVYNGTDALAFAQAERYDGIILDIMMPGLSGLEVLRRLRAAGCRTPVLLLTAKAEVEDQIQGLDLGADDYLTKPFATQELLARLRALLRRGGAKQSTVLAVADLCLDPASRRVTRGGREIALSAREFALLEYLLRNAGMPLTRQMIEEHVWNYDYQGGSNVVDVYIRTLRGKLEIQGEKRLIHTVRNVGYVLREEA